MRIGAHEWGFSQAVAPTDAAAWAEHDARVREHPHGALQQTHAWGQFQQSFPDRRLEGVFTVRADHRDVWSSALVTQRLPGGWSYLLAPRGPLLAHEPPPMTFEVLRRFLRSAFPRALFLRMDPPFPRESPEAAEFRGLVEQVPFLRAPETVPTTTLVLDLRLDEPRLLAEMHPKGRYNIRVAERHGVRCRTGTPQELPAFYRLLRATAERTGIRIHPPSVYAAMLHTLGTHAELLVAEHEGRMVAGLLSTRFRGTTTYYYGGSDHAARQLMAPYLLQWEAVRRARAAGDQWYDFLGIAPEGSDGHPLAGVTDFKRKFGGIVRTEIAPVDLLLRPTLARSFRIARAALHVLRRRP